MKWLARLWADSTQHQHVLTQTQQVKKDLAERSGTVLKAVHEAFLKDPYKMNELRAALAQYEADLDRYWRAMSHL